MSETLDGEAVVLHLGTGKYFALNESGTRMWALLSQHTNGENVVERLRQDYPQENGQTLRSDLEGFIAELLARGLLEQIEG